MEIIAEGAEAKISKINNTTLKKERLAKKYRLEIIDNKLRKFRNKREFKVLTKLYENNINVPKPLEISNEKKEISFTLEFINGSVLKKELNEKNLKKAFNEIIKMHNQDIVHGDLTTLNMILKRNDVYLIDFGLSEFSMKIEDKAVDLNLFFTCIKNEHPDFFKYKEELEKQYEKKAHKGKEILERLKKVELRGRNK